LSVKCFFVCERSSEEPVITAAEDIQPLATDFQISLSTSLIVLAVYTATLHVSVPGGDSGIHSVVTLFVPSVPYAVGLAWAADRRRRRLSTV